VNRLITLGNLRARFNLALDIGSAGLSEGMVCALPENTREPKRGVGGT
jgi:hypothetical protein